MAPKSSQDSFHHDLAGRDVLARDDEKFKRYRKLWESNPASLTHGGFPLHLDIEVTSVCNLRCPFCVATISRGAIRNGFIDRALVERVLDEGQEHDLYACKFNSRGEPLLHREIAHFVAHAKKRGVLDVFFNTNGVLLDEEAARGLIDAGLDRLTISIEGTDKATYEKYRVGSNFERLLGNVVGLQELKARLGVSHPLVRVQSVLVPEVAADIDGYVAFWRDKADQVSCNEMLDNQLDPQKAFVSDWICPYLYQRMMILWDGTITTCSNDVYERNALGSIGSTSISQCWAGAFQKVRDLHEAGRAHEVPACGDCPIRYSEAAKQKAAV